VRPAPDARVNRWTTRPAPRLADAPTLAPDWAADVTLRVARLALSRPSAHPMVPSILRIGARYESAGSPGR
jgi:hypothetical protein